MVASLLAVGFSGSAAAQESTLDGMDGSGTEEDPYVVTTVDELQAMNQDLDAHYVLGNDIDASETENWNAGAGFEPVGGNDDQFSGSLDGQNHTITGLTIDRPNKNLVGLFGVNTGTVEHVRVDSASVTASQSVGVVVGSNSEGNISGLYVSGTVSGESNVGGLAGGNGGVIVRSGAAVDVTATGRSAGGLIGVSGGDPALRRVYATGDVSGEDEVGGLLGASVGTPVQSAFATGSVEGVANVGGLVGELSGQSASRVYATGDVDARSQAGGLVGDLGSGDISRAYVDSALTADDSNYDSYGNVVGNKNNRATFSGVYLNSETATYSIADTEGVTALSTAEMQGPAARENMAELNFGPAWTATGDYPVHRWSVANVSFSLEENRIARGDSTEATVDLDIVDGRTLSGTETASYGTNSSIASVDAGTVSTSGVGTVNVTASIAGETETDTLTVLEPPNITATAASIDEGLVARGVAVDIETTVINTGDIAGEDPVYLRIDGETITEVSVTGEPGVEKNVSVVWRPESLGTYDVAVDDASAGTVEVVEPPELTTESASTNVSAVSAGASVPVSVTIANDDRLRGARNATLAVDGENVSSELVSVGAQNQTTTALSWTPAESGTYDLAVDGVSAGSVTVVPADSVSVESVSAPGNATAGEPFSADVTVNNTANVTVSERLRLTANGETVGATWADLTANGTTTVTVAGVVNSSGATTLTAESTSGSSSTDLSVLEPASFAITTLDVPSSVTAGQTATVSATVENRGGVAGSRTVTFSVGGSTLTSETVELAAGATTTVSGDISPSSAGETQVTAETADDNRTATVTVDTASTPTETGGTGTDTSSGSGPGFGVAAALVALLSGAALRRGL